MSLWSTEKLAPYAVDAIRDFRNSALEEVAEMLVAMRGEKPKSITRAPFNCGRWVGIGEAVDAVRKLKEESDG